MIFMNILCLLCSFVMVSVITAKEIERKLWPTIRKVEMWKPIVKTRRIVSENEYRSKNEIKQKKGKVFHLFPIPVDGECLSNDSRRTGTCLNIYECHQRGGLARGECSMGFGVCCVFISSCEQIISNNITYLVSPNFPSSMPNNLTSCEVKVVIMDSNISQLRVDFNHFSLGQPNRKTGICDGDIFNISGGLSGNLVLCGQNSGQHIYYDVIQPLPTVKNKQTSPSMENTTKNNILSRNGAVTITMKFINRFLPTRLWEIRIVQIPFSQRAPNSCLQYYLGSEGVIQTFNFADNGRHLANQHYRSCIRQEANMCSIMYEPCDDQSFKIGPTRGSQIYNGMTAADFPFIDSPMEQISTTNSDQSTSADTSVLADAVLTDSTTDGTSLMDIEGSGGGTSPLPIIPSKRPVRGGFDILSFFRSAFAFKKYKKSPKQFFTTCNDRITMPCIIEDFVGAGMGPLPGCEPVHCGHQFCSSGTKPCRIESTVTPFYLGVNFGNGIGKGSAEDNIGACIRYSQMQCI